MEETTRPSIDAHLRKIGLSNLAVARTCGVTIHTVRQWRTGNATPTSRNASILIRELGFPPEMFGEPHEPVTALDRVMIDKQISVGELAKLVNVTASSVLGWRLGLHRPGIDNAKLVAAVLGMPLYLIRPDVWDVPPSLRRQEPETKTDDIPRDCAA